MNEEENHSNERQPKNQQRKLSPQATNIFSGILGSITLWIGEHIPAPLYSRKVEPYALERTLDIRFRKTPGRAGWPVTSVENVGRRCAKVNNEKSHKKHHSAQQCAKQSVPP